MKNNLQKNGEGTELNPMPSKNKQSKTILQRKCVGCGKLYPRHQLLRILKVSGTNELVISPTTKQFGRSAYVCYNVECVKIAIKKKRLQKTLKTSIPDEILKNIESVLN